MDDMTFWQICSFGNHFALYYIVPSAFVVLKIVTDTTAVYTYLSEIKMAELHPPNKREINIV